MILRLKSAFFVKNPTQMNLIRICQNCSRNKFTRSFIFIAFIFLGNCCGIMNTASHAAEAKFPSLKPVKPADVASTFRVQDDFKMELLAAEPLVTDPVAMVYD